MRTILAALILIAAPALAEERQPIAARVPAGATAYFEVDGLARRTEEFFESPLFAAIKNHPTTQKFLASPEGQKLQFGQGMLQGMIGLDVRGLLKAVGQGRIAGAFYAQQNQAVLLVEMDPKVAQRLIGAIEFATQKPRQEVLPANDQGAALYRVGKAFVCIEPGLTILATDERVARRVRAREGEMLHANPNLAHARRLVAGQPLVFGVVDLKPFQQKMQSKGKPKNFGEAILFGALPHDVSNAPWAAVGFDFRIDGRRWILRSEARVPAAEERSEGVAKAFGGTLGDLAFDLPEQTIAVARMKRNLSQLWEYQDDLIAENALPELVKFSSNFKTLTGLTFTEELLPRLGDEVTLVAVRRDWKEGAAVPEVKIPHAAMIWPVKTDERMRQSIDLAFQQVMSLIGLQQAEMSRKFMVMRETYKEIPIMTARYPAPAEGEMKGRRALPIRYNFTPAAAVVGDHYVLSTTDELLKMLIDGRAGSTAAPAGKNAGFWVAPAPGVAMLRENRSALVAQRMLKEGEDKPTAERTTDILLEFASLLTDLDFTVDEGRASLGLSARLVFEAPEK
ncbi:MAG: DUF3352 domain-containing protein [Planctomycetota bacterium]|jgi:hypothetical protein